MQILREAHIKHIIKSIYKENKYWDRFLIPFSGFSMKLLGHCWVFSYFHVLVISLPLAVLVLLAWRQYRVTYISMLNTLLVYISQSLYVYIYISIYIHITSLSTLLVYIAQSLYIYIYIYI